MATYQRLIRANIAAELGRRDLTQRDAALRLRMSGAALTSRMVGRTDFKLGELIVLARYLEVPFSTLVIGLDDSSPCEEVPS